jgi:hypothetical protein
MVVVDMAGHQHDAKLCARNIFAKNLIVFIKWA